MRLLTLIFGVICMAEVLTDAFQTIILPRRASGKFRVSKLFTIATWIPWRGIASRMRDTRRRESFLSYFGPLSLLLLVVGWAAGLRRGFALPAQPTGQPF